MCCIRSMSSSRMAHLPFLTHRPGDCHTNLDPLSASWAWYIMQWPAHSTLEESRFWDFIMSYRILGLKRWYANALSISKKNWEAPPKDTIFVALFSLVFPFNSSILFMWFNQTNRHHSEGLEVPCKPYGEKGGPLDPWGTLPKDRDIEGERISYGMQNCKSEQPWMIQWNMAGSGHPLKSQGLSESVWTWYLFCDFPYYEPYEHLILLPYSNRSFLCSSYFCIFLGVLLRPLPSRTSMFKMAVRGLQMLYAKFFHLPRWYGKKTTDGHKFMVFVLHCVLKHHIFVVFTRLTYRRFKTYLRLSVHIYTLYYSLLDIMVPC